MFQNSACTLNGKHTFYDYGLYVGNTMPVAPPTVRKQMIEVPGRNGDIDLTEALTGYTVYNNRQITLQLGGKKNPRIWHSFMSSFLNEIHGKTVRVIFDDDPEFYFIGRAEVQGDAVKGNEVCTFTVIIDAEPYKYSLHDTSEPWLWDPFSFVDGVIRTYSNIQVSGTKTVTLINELMPVIPIITASAAMTVRFNGKNYSLSAGVNKIYDISLGPGENTLIFTGSGTVSIKFRPGRL